MDQRLSLIGDWLSGAFSKSELSWRYGVSRPTVDKWIARYLSLGADGLKEASRRPSSSPWQTSEAILSRLIALKQAHPAWGPKKLVDILQVQEPAISWPAPSTAGVWLDRVGLVKKRRFRRHHGSNVVELREANQPNQTWCADYKGQFKMRNGQWCYPLTISDHASRHLLACRAQPQITSQSARQAFEWAFREYGLPDVIRSDNGSPFAAPGLARVSTLAVWWIRLGIYPERIALGRPDQNGRHERMHRSLKAEVPLGHNLLEQQLLLERFREEYNYLRPHEGLGMQRPGDLYLPSPRSYPGCLPAVEYAADMEVRSVRQNGSIRWKNRLLFLSEALAGEQVALREVDNDVWDLYLCSYPLGRLERGANRVSSLKV